MALVPHLALLSFLRLREVLVDVGCGDQGPGQIVSVADALETCGFGGETCGGVELPDSAFNAGELVHVLDGFLGFGDLGGEGKSEVIEYRRSGWNDVR